MPDSKQQHSFCIKKPKSATDFGFSLYLISDIFFLEEEES
jgi:hypothetical protein